MANLENRFANQRANPLMLLKTYTGMADRAGVRNSSPINHIPKQTATTAPVENQRFSPVLANRIRELARDVRRIGRGHRCDAESIAIDKDCIAVELGRLAGRLDRRATQ